MYYVYKLTAPNNKCYIGMTSRNPKKRWNSGCGYKYNKELWNDIVNYGWYNFIREVVMKTENEDEAHEKEIDLILLYDATNPKYGYNKVVSSNRISKVIKIGVTCVNTNNKFRSLSKASKYAHTSVTYIKEVCDNKREYAGSHPKTGQKLKWKYTKYID